MCLRTSLANRDKLLALLFSIKNPDGRPPGFFDDL
jgi:hypothetical protein